MKRKQIFSIVILCSLVVLFWGCAQETNVATPTKSEGLALMPAPHPSLRTREEIVDFSRSDLAPAGFIFPEDLRVMGEAKDVLTFLPSEDGNYSKHYYAYIVTDQNDVYYQVSISHLGKPGPDLSSKLKLTEQILSKNVEMKDMRCLEAKESGWIVRQDIRYFYIHGKLCGLTFYVGDIEIAIEYYYQENEHSPIGEEDTFLSKLLSVNDEKAYEAVEEVRWVILWRNIGKWLIPTGIGVGVVALGATGFAIWKKKKRKAADKPESPEPQPVDTPQQT